MELEKTADEYIEGLPALLHKRISINKRWEMGIYPVIYGYRVRVGLVGSRGTSLDYCAGDNPMFLGLLYAVVLAILETIPEEISEHDLIQLFPTYERRPISSDPCWGNLLKLVADREAKLIPEDFEVTSSHLFR